MIGKISDGDMMKEGGVTMGRDCYPRTLLVHLGYKEIS